MAALPFEDHERRTGREALDIVAEAVREGLAAGKASTEFRAALTDEVILQTAREIGLLRADTRTAIDEGRARGRVLEKVAQKLDDLGAQTCNTLNFIAMKFGDADDRSDADRRAFLLQEALGLQAQGRASRGAGRGGGCQTPLGGRGSRRRPPPRGCQAHPSRCEGDPGRGNAGEVRKARRSDRGRGRDRPSGRRRGRSIPPLRGSRRCNGPAGSHRGRGSPREKSSDPPNTACATVGRVLFARSRSGGRARQSDHPLRRRGRRAPARRGGGGLSRRPPRRHRDRPSGGWGESPEQSRRRARGAGQPHRRRGRPIASLSEARPRSSIRWTGRWR